MLRRPHHQRWVCPQGVPCGQTLVIATKSTCFCGDDYALIQELQAQ
jgi:hypothetical protein